MSGECELRRVQLAPLLEDQTCIGRRFAFGDGGRVDSLRVAMALIGAGGNGGGATLRRADSLKGSIKIKLATFGL